MCQIRIALTVVDGEAAQGDGAPDGREARASGRKSSRVKGVCVRVCVRVGGVVVVDSRRPGAGSCQSKLTVFHLCSRVLPSTQTAQGVSPRPSSALLKCANSAFGNTAQEDADSCGW